MSIPKEPRQLMINLMYLVLTALLALNVSNEILNAFKTIRKSIVDSNDGTKSRNSVVSSNFDKYIPLAKDPKKKLKLQLAKELAAKVNELTNAAVQNIEAHKNLIITASGGIDPVTNEIKRISDLDASTRIMIEEGADGKEVNDVKNSRGEILKAALNKFKDELSTLIPIDDSVMTPPAPNKNEEFFKNLPMKLEVAKTIDNPNQNWSYGNFHMSPSIASVTILDKYISDVRACETQALDDIWAKAFGEKVNQSRTLTRTQARTFDSYGIIVAAENNFLMPGEKYRATIMMGTYNKNLKNLTINVNGANVPVIDGMATYEAIASGTGPKQVNVTATFNDSVNGPQVVKMKTPAVYMVGEASASIELEKMNVMYATLQNPLNVSASGIQADKIALTPSAGINLNKVTGIGRYECEMPESMAGKEVTINMKGTLPDGTVKDLGTKKYRIKRVPSPYAIVGKYKGGNIGAGTFRIQPFLIAKLDDFVYDLKWQIISYDIQAVRKGQLIMDVPGVKSSYLNDNRNPNKQVIEGMDRLKPGDVVYIENIKAEMVGGKYAVKRDLDDLKYKLN